MESLEVTVVMETNDRVRVKITDAVEKRFEVPCNMIRCTKGEMTHADDATYTVESADMGEEFWITVRRRSNNQTLFDTKGYSLVYKVRPTKFTYNLLVTMLFIGPIHRVHHTA